MAADHTRTEKDLPDASKVLAALKERQNGAKGLPARGGWVYLINDANDFLSYQFGVCSWTQKEKERVHEILSERRDYFTRAQIFYMMVITPEKSVTYSEWLPSELAALSLANDRPALHVAERFAAIVSYPLDYLQAMKCHGLLFFRGDTHVNWLGAFHLYHHTIDAMRDRGFDLGEAISLRYFQLQLASWDGDMLLQIPEALKAEFEKDSANWRPMFMHESMVQFTLHPDYRRAYRLSEPDVFRIGRPERETIVTRHADTSLPRAVIFRDSTASLLIDLLAEHFSRAVFVWHENDVIGSLIEQEKPDVVLHFKSERFLASCPMAVPIFY